MEQKKPARTAKQRGEMYKVMLGVRDYCTKHKISGSRLMAETGYTNAHRLLGDKIPTYVTSEVKELLELWLDENRAKGSIGEETQQSLDFEDKATAPSQVAKLLDEKQELLAAFSVQEDNLKSALMERDAAIDRYMSVTAKHKVQVTELQNRINKLIDSL